MDKKTFFCTVAPKEYAAYEEAKKQASIVGKNLRSARLAWLAARSLAAPPHPLEGSYVSCYSRLGKKYAGYVHTYRLGDYLSYPPAKVLPGDAIVRPGPVGSEKNIGCVVPAYELPWRLDTETEEKRAADGANW